MFIDKILKIMELDCPSHQPLPFFQTFVQHIWNVFHIVCRDLFELRHLVSTVNNYTNSCRSSETLNCLQCASLFPKYVEPVERGERECIVNRSMLSCHFLLVTHKEPRQLWRHIEPHFKTVMSRIYLRGISLTEHGGLASDDPSSSSCPLRVLELPTFSKYLLIASFLASYNPSKSDRRIFSKVRIEGTRR